MEFFLQPEVLFALFLVAGLAGFIDTIAGGGGLIALPALLLAQVPPIEALATNKLQGSFGTLTSALTMIKKRKVRFKDIRWLFVASLIGSVVGTIVVHFINPEVLDVIIPVVLIAIALYFLLAPAAGQHETPPKISDKAYRWIATPLIGFYDGFFGPGTGALFSASKVYLRGRELIRATATAKVLNFASNVSSLIIFAFSGKVVWIVGGAMICGQIVGAYAGTHMVISKGSKLIRPLIVTICIAMAIRYFWEKFGG